MAALLLVDSLELLISLERSVLLDTPVLSLLNHAEKYAVAKKSP